MGLWGTFQCSAVALANFITKEKVFVANNVAKNILSFQREIFGFTSRPLLVIYAFCRTDSVEQYAISNGKGFCGVCHNNSWQAYILCGVPFVET